MKRILGSACETAATSHVSRRIALGGLLTSSAPVLFGRMPAWAVAPTGTLRAVGERSGILYGLCETGSRYGGNRDYFERLAAECSLFSPGNDFNWRAVAKSPNQLGFGSLDVMANYCRRHNLGMIGHTLAWYHTVPDWAKVLNADAFRKAFSHYAATTIERFSDVVVRWDVVNEAIDVRSDRSDGLRKSDFLVKLGPSYIADAFVHARSMSGKASLCLNEYGIESIRPESIRKRALFLELIRDLRRRKAPIDLIGLQSHLDASDPIDVIGFSVFLREVKELGYGIVISELDVNDVNLPGDTAVRDAKVAEHVDRYLGCVLSEIRPRAIVNWGYGDSRSWLQGLYKRPDGLPLRPLAFDADLNRKPVWSVLSRHIAGADR